MKWLTRGNSFIWLSKSEIPLNLMVQKRDRCVWFEESREGFTVN